MPFRFRLEAPLRLARVHRQERRRELAEAVQQAALAQAKADHARAVVEQGSSHRVESLRSGVTGEELRWLDEQLRRGRQRLQRAQSSTDESQEREERARVALAEETRRLEALEQIRHRRLTEYRRALSRREQLQVDEITLNRFARRRRGADGGEER